MSTDEFCLVEDFDDLPSFPCANIISLSPKASYFLGKRNIAYTCIEAYYSEKALRESEFSYFQQQSQWFNDFDNLFRQSISAAPLKHFSLARAFYSRLKYLVDSTVLRSRIVKSFLDKTNARTIHYFFRKDNLSEADNASLFDFQSPSRRSLLPLFRCRAEKNEDLKIHLYFCPAEKPGADVSRALLVSQTSRARTILKNVVYFLRHKKIKKLFHGSGLKGLSFIFLDRGSLEIDPVITELIHAGAKVFFSDGKKIWLTSGVWERTVLDLRASISQKSQQFLHEQCEEAFERLTLDHPVRQQINQQCGMDVSEYLLPFLKNFMVSICPETCVQAETLRGFMKSQSIDYVIARACAAQEQVGSLLAAADLGLDKICFQHGTGALQMVHYLNELFVFEHYFAADPFSQDYFIKESERYGGTKAQISQSAQYLQHFEMERKRRSKALLKCRKRPQITYVTHHNFTGMREFHNLGYPLVWYFEFQKKVIDLFAARADYEFIYKLPHGVSDFSIAISAYIRDKSSSNVHISQRPLAYHLKRTDRVLMDYPATAFFESIVSGLPTFAACADFLGLQVEQEKVWGDRGMLKKFSSFEEAIEVMSEFLSRPSTSFQAAISLGRADIVAFIKKFHRLRRNP
jgi:hypothetical protein